MSNFLVIRRPKYRHQNNLNKCCVFISASNASEAKRKASAYEEMQPAPEYNKSFDVIPIEDGKVIYL